MSSTMLRTIAAAATLTVAAAGPAVAQATSPVGPDASALRAAGVTVSWPISAPAPFVAAGSTVTVTVGRIAGRRGVPVRLSLVRTTPGGRAIAAVKTRILRRGTFTARVGTAAGTHYALTLKAGKVRYTGRFSTVAVTDHNLTPPTGKTKPVQIDPGAIDPCTPQDPADAPSIDGALHVGATTVAAGDAVPYSIENRGDDCLTVGVMYSWQRLDGGTWTDVPQTLAFIAIGYVVPPGATWSGGSGQIAAPTEATFVPGRYRLVTTAYGMHGSHDGSHPDLVLTAEVDVVAPAP